MTLRRTRDEGCISDFMLDRVFSDPLSRDEVAGVEAHLSSCARCAARAEVVRAAQHAFSPDLPPALETRARRRDELTTKRRRWGFRAGGALAVAAVALLFARSRVPADEVSRRGERTKGAPRVMFHVQHDGGVRPGTEGDRLVPGDAIEFAYSSHDGGYLAILSVDGASRVSLYHADGDLAAPIAPGVEIALPHSTILDATLGEEVIYALFCPRPIALGPIRAALAAEPLRAPAPTGCTVDPHRFVKEMR